MVDKNASPFPILVFYFNLRYIFPQKKITLLCLQYMPKFRARCNCAVQNKRATVYVLLVIMVNIFIFLLYVLLVIMVNIFIFLLYMFY